MLLEKRITYIAYQMIIQCESLGNHLMFWGKMEICRVLPCEKLQNAHWVKNIIFLKRKALKSLKWLNKLLSKAKEIYQIDMSCKIPDAQLNLNLDKQWFFLNHYIPYTEIYFFKKIVLFTPNSNLTCYIIFYVLNLVILTPENMKEAIRIQ